MTRYLIEITDQALDKEQEQFAIHYPNRNMAIVKEQQDLDSTGKIILHIYGHLKGLEHCSDPECIMFDFRTRQNLEKIKKYCDNCK